MEQMLSSAAATVSAAAVLFLTFAALGIILGANQLRDLALKLTGGALVVALLARGCIEVVGKIDPSVQGATGQASGADALVCFSVGVGHVVLAIVLVARWLRPRAAVERAEEQRRARMRQRVRVPPRDHELEP